MAAVHAAGSKRAQVAAADNWHVLNRAKVLFKPISRKYFKN
jgi:hypothetical protein